MRHYLIVMLLACGLLACGSSKKSEPAPDKAETLRLQCEKARGTLQEEPACTAYAEHLSVMEHASLLVKIETAGDKATLHAILDRAFALGFDDVIKRAKGRYPDAFRTYEIIKCTEIAAPLDVRLARAVSDPKTLYAIEADVSSAIVRTNGMGLNCDFLEKVRQQAVEKLRNGLAARIMLAMSPDELRKAMESVGEYGSLFTARQRTELRDMCFQNSRRLRARYPRIRTDTTICD